MDSYVEGISLRAHLRHQLQLQVHRHFRFALDWLVPTDLPADGAAGACHENALAFVLAPPAQTAVNLLISFSIIATAMTCVPQSLHGGDLRLWLLILCNGRSIKTCDEG